MFLLLLVLLVLPNRRPVWAIMVRAIACRFKNARVVLYACGVLMPRRHQALSGSQESLYSANLRRGLPSATRRYSMHTSASASPVGKSCSGGVCCIPALNVLRGGMDSDAFTTPLGQKRINKSMRLRVTHRQSGLPICSQRCSASQVGRSRSR